MKRLLCLVVAVLMGASPLAMTAAEPASWPGFVASKVVGEQVREIRFSEDARAIVLAPAADGFDVGRPTLLVIYATPNGNTAEQTLGCQLTEGLDWHYDIQHAAAQWRTYRRMVTDRNLVLACVQSNQLSWPLWKSSHPQGPRLIRRLVESLRASTPGSEVQVVLTGHSGGGSFLFGFLEAVEAVPDYVERIAFLDANYSYDSQQHGQKIVDWLTVDPGHVFAVIAYDDRNIELDGKKVVGPTGGTYRATHRMLDFFGDKLALTHDQQGEFQRHVGFDGRLVLDIHPNPENIILHTRLVGEMNGLLEVLSIGTPQSGVWGSLAAPRAYTAEVQKQPFQPDDWHPYAPALPSRPAQAEDGTPICKALFEASTAEREAVFTSEVLKGNVPDFWRKFVEVTVEATDTEGQPHRIRYRVAPDYLAIGSDADFVRLPLTPDTAQHLADMLGCVLPTRKMVNDIYNQATDRQEPLPLVERREALATFCQHNSLIQANWQRPAGPHLFAGLKKDVVVTNQLAERPGHLAIYGWHRLDGTPIQPLTTVHVATYVDYSHGVRLVDQWAEVDGQRRRISEVLRDPRLCNLLSDEGPLKVTAYPSD